MSKVLITTVPFGEKNYMPIELLENSCVEYLINPLNKKLSEDELAKMITDFDVIIAGTEQISDKVLEKAPNLKMISRVGIGLDSVDLLAAEKRGITVSYTPEAPAPAVAELTICLMLALLRFVHLSNLEIHDGRWHRFFGRRLSEVTIGLIGIGRIGTGVLKHLKGFGSPKILVNDILSNRILDQEYDIEWVEKEQIYEEADIISFHTPLNKLTKNMVTKDELINMKEDAIVINTARGGIINEQDLYDVMETGHLGGAAIDVFEQEPYYGNLCGIDRCLLTAHMGSMSVDCRTRMEIDATKEAVRFILGKDLEWKVPEDEYEAQRENIRRK